MITKQSSLPCKTCGSYYRNGNHCNVCGEFLIEPKYTTLRKQIKPMKRLWSKRKHRYLTQEEISRGEKGG